MTSELKRKAMEILDRRKQCEGGGQKRSDVATSQGKLTVTRIWKRQTATPLLLKEAEFQTSSLQNYEKINSCAFKPPILW